MWSILEMYTSAALPAAIGGSNIHEPFFEEVLKLTSYGFNILQGFPLGHKMCQISHEAEEGDVRDMPLPSPFT